MSGTSRGVGLLRSRLVPVLGGLAAGLLLCELVVRLFGLAPQLGPIRLDWPYGSFVSSDNAVLRYVPNPGVGDINADGFRDRPYSRRKPAGVTRIVVLGDSIGFGYCNDKTVLPIEATFPKPLEAELERDPGAVEVLNFSVSGYDTLQEVEFLREKALG